MIPVAIEHPRSAPTSRGDDVVSRATIADEYRRHARGALLAGALAVGLILTVAVPASATETRAAPSTYSVRVEAVGYTTVYNDAGFQLPYADPHAPHTIGTIGSALPATGFAAVVNPGSAANGLSALSQAEGGPVLPSNPTVVETRAGDHDDGSFGKSGLFEVTSHSDTAPSTRQRAVTASDDASAGAPVLATGPGSATTSAAIAGGVVSGAADVVLEDVSVPDARFAARSVHSQVQVAWAAGGEPTVNRRIEVLGATVDGRPVDVIPEGTLTQPQQGGPPIAVAQGRAGPRPDGSYEASSDGVAVRVPVQGTLQTVTVLLGSTRVAMNLASGTTTLPVVLPSAPPMAASAPGPAGVAPSEDTIPRAAPPGLAAQQRSTARRSTSRPARLASITEERFPLVWLYLCWLCLGAGLVAAACRVVSARGGEAGPRPEIFD